MTPQTSIDQWNSNSEDNTTSEQTTKSEDKTEPKNDLPESLREHVEQFKEARLREIPFAERYPVWWGRLRKNGMSAKSLAELKKCTARANHHFDDREDDDWKEHFAEIHLHTDH